MSGTTVDAAITTTRVIDADTSAGDAAAKAAAAAVPTKTTETKASEAKAEDTKATVLADAAQLKETKVDAEGKPIEQKSEIVYDIKAPDGVELDKTAVDKFISEVAKATGLSNEQAQAVIEYGAKHNIELQESQQAELNAAVVAARDAEWEELKKDPTFGGANWDKTKTDAARAFQKFADDKERAFINTHLLGDRGPMITLFAKIHRALSEGSTQGKGTNHRDVGAISTAEDLYRQMYPRMYEDNNKE
jgi:hypothetical protein